MRSGKLVFGKLRRFRNDENGAALLEFTAVVFVLFLVLFGIIEFSLAFFQWNSATKAMQVGARLASVSSPVWDELDEIRGDEKSNVIPGQPLNANFGTGEAANFGYKVQCDGAASTCTKLEDQTGVGGLKFNFDAAAMNRIVFGRGSPTTPTAANCGDISTDRLSGFGMCDIFRAIRPQNVVITYEHSNLGYATRPGGVVPTIKVELKNIFFNFVFLDDLMGLNQVQIPGLVTTIPAEDLCSFRPDLPKWDNPC